MCQQGPTCTGIKLKTIVSQMVKKCPWCIWSSNPVQSFRRCTWGVLWRISHVHEVSYILRIDRDRERKSYQMIFCTRSWVNLENVADRIILGVTNYHGGSFWWWKTSDISLCKTCLSSRHGVNISLELELCFWSPNE